ncbi:type II toxin-antitoxin system prevent-host-death family antitoxin [Nocardia colli]|uniref:Type II toxin-antitoxin system prevent-host-death family antitoxin n=1 Tax=Nocardia colli TaxID=2545717 RepID=A0A5N0EFE3_9NOCA|nr:type II toxin-antitoxin system prevent-host-death family antitoxin [Nocardia colli]KAA8888112.1 type II toxin-antitoxin system prevent-host-death family antitoxin [Nocardia colli]
MTSVRVPITTASRKGVSGLVAASEEQRVVLTSHGRPVAVVDSADRIDEDMRKIREAKLAILDAAADLASNRTRKFNLAEVCVRLGVDESRVRALAAERVANQ